MMNIFNKSFTLKKIQPGTVCKFKYIKPGFDSNMNLKEHYYLLLTMADGSLLIFVMFTSKVEKTKERYIKTLNKEAYESLVEISKTDFNFLTTLSIIDCNSPIYGSVEEISASIVGEVEVISTDIGAKLFNKIIDAVIDSPMVPSELKGKLRLCGTSAEPTKTKASQELTHKA